MNHYISSSYLPAHICLGVIKTITTPYWNIRLSILVDFLQTTIWVTKMLWTRDKDYIKRKIHYKINIWSWNKILPCTVIAYSTIMNGGHNCPLVINTHTDTMLKKVKENKDVPSYL